MLLHVQTAKLDLDPETGKREAMSTQLCLITSQVHMVVWLQLPTNTQKAMGT